MHTTDSTRCFPCCLTDGPAATDVLEAVRQAAREVLAEEPLKEAQRALLEMEEQSIERGQRYFRERQWRVNVAAIAGRVILRAHRESHTGTVSSCATCADDWATMEEASGVIAPDR